MYIYIHINIMALVYLQSLPIFPPPVSHGAQEVPACDHGRSPGI